MRLPFRGSSTPSADEEKAHGGDAPPSYDVVTRSDADQTASLQLHPLPSKDALIVQIRPPTAPAPAGAATGFLPPIVSLSGGTRQQRQQQQQQHQRHIPCDIVLVIDVSGSMGIRADVPGEEAGESPGLSVLDLTKHAALTILETLDERDRLGIVTFSSRSQIVQRLIPMTPANKDATRKNLKHIKKQDATNLWHGLLDGIKLFKEADDHHDDEAGDIKKGVKNSKSSSSSSSSSSFSSSSSLPSSRVPAMMVLTDGKPNFMCPQAGYVSKLRGMLPLPASIHTFGFGYNLESGLLKSIAEIGGGNYAFIPDAGMIGTVFVHAVANLQSTFATDAVLELTYPRGLDIQECMGEYVDQQQPEPTPDGSGWRLVMKLGNLQYGQSRDIFLQVDGTSAGTCFGFGFSEKNKGSSSVVAAQLRYKPSGSEIEAMSIAQRSMLDASNLPEAEIAYHDSRARICRFISSVFPLNPMEVHTALLVHLVAKKRDELTVLVDELPAQRFKDSDARNRSLVDDLAGPEPRGQVSLAVGNYDYFKRWGVHYLPSLLNAHTRQVCNSFKDQGPLQYGVNSPLFVECRNRLDNAFDNLPAPEPSLPPRGRGFISGGPMERSNEPMSGHRVGFSMSRYHNPLGVCFAGSTPVELAATTATATAACSAPIKRASVPIRTLRRGMMIRTPLGARRVAAVLKTRVEDATLCRVPGGVLVTPWHPIAGETGKNWVFPAQVALGTVRYTGYVYSVMLQRDEDARAHTLRVGPIWGTTLGHGITKPDMDGDSDVRAHEFFGDYDRVSEALLRLGIKRNGVAVGKGVVRDEETGLVMGFRARNT